MSQKMEIIKKSEAFLELYGFTQQDYIVSLQGPTIILSVSGIEKMRENGNLKNELLNVGIQIL